MKQTTGGSGARRRRLRQLQPLATVLVATLGMVGAAAVPATALAADPASAAPTPAAGTTTRTVTLVTGDRVIVTTVGGQTRYIIDPAVPGDAAFQSYRDAQGDYHVVPALAEPFLGTTLNPALFDVTAQLRANARTASMAEVSTGTSAQLVAALRKAIGADVKAGRTPGTTVPHLTGIPAAPKGDSRVPATAATGYPQRDLQLNVTDRSGHPTTGLAMVMNTDSSTKFQAQVPINGGVDRVALPAGHYSVEYTGETYDTQGNLTSALQLTRTDFTVPATGTVPDVVLDGRTAVPVHVATPLPSTTQMINMGWYRTDASSPTQAGNQDGAMGFAYTLLGNIPFATNPQPAAKVGLVSSELQWVGGDAKGTYSYDTDFPAKGVPDVSALKVTAAQLTTEHNHYYADPATPTQGEEADLPVDYTTPGALNGTALLPQSMPADVTKYLNVVPQHDWFQEVVQGSGLMLTADPVAPKAGATSSVDWGRGPLAPGVGQHTLPAGAVNTCAACAAGADLSLTFNDFNDSTPGHQGSPGYEADGTPMQVTSSMSTYQNGQLLGTTPNSPTFSISDAPAAGAQYKVVYDTTAGAPVSQSTSADTTLVFSTTPAAEAGAALTPLGSCTGQSQTTPCQVLPLLNINTQLAVSESGTAAAGTETMGLNIGHVSYNGTGSHAAITSAGVQVSFDGGTTWQNAQLSHTGAASAGTYTASWTNPAADAGVHPSIRITATDAVGGSISQTVNNAYEIVKGA